MMSDQKQKAVQLIQSGQFQAAASVCKRLVKASPRDFEAKFLMGLAQFRMGAHVNARNSFKGALRLNPASVSAITNLAVCEYELGKFADAIERLEHATELDPNAVAAHQELAKNLVRIGEYKRALASANTALQRQPSSPDLRMLRGDILFSLLDWESAAADFEFVFQQSPNNRRALQFWAVSVARSGQTNRLNQMCLDFAKRPANTDFGANLVYLAEVAESILGGGNYAESLAISTALLPAIQLADSAYPEADLKTRLLDGVMLRKIVAEQFLLEPELVKKSIDDAIKNGTDTTAFLRCKLGLLLDMGRKEESLNLCEDLLSRGPPAADLYGTMTELRSLDETDPYLAEMKAMLARKDLPQDEKIVLQFVLAKALRDIGGDDASFEHLNQGNMSKHEIVGETASKLMDRFSWARNTHAKFKFSAVQPESDLSPRPIFVIGMPRSGTSLIEQILSGDRQTSGVGELPFLGLKINSLLGPSIRTPTDDEMSIIRRSYLEYVSTLASRAAVTIDKTPLNIFYVGFILSAMPEAKIIHTYRDPRAVCWSNYKTLFHSNNIPVAYRFRDLAKFYQNYRSLMNYWESAFPGKIHHQCYEELTSDPERESQKLYDFCELEWTSKAIEFGENQRQVRTVSRLQVRDKIYAGSSDEWRKYESFLAPMTDALAARKILSADGVFTSNYGD